MSTSSKNKKSQVKSDHHSGLNRLSSESSIPTERYANGCDSQSGNWPKDLGDRETQPDHAHPHAHRHVHSAESQRQIINRLSRIEGHIRGIKTMVHEDRHCPEVLIQIAAVRGALDRVARLILDEHLTECVARAAQEGNIEEELSELKAALDRFLP